MSKIKTLLDLAENIDDMSVDDGDGRVDVWQSDELTKAIREAKLEHE